MLRELCEACGAVQPRDWRAGELCVACGCAVRREVRCAGCTRWTPAGRFCRACGAELIAASSYGAARMLRAAGVDAFTLAGRLAQLDPAQIATLQARFDAQFGVMLRCVDELRLVQAGLLDDSHADSLEELLTAQLPWSEAELGKFQRGLPGPFHHRLDLLPQIAATSPIAATGALAAIAAYRHGLSDDLRPIETALFSPDAIGPDASIPSAIAPNAVAPNAIALEAALLCGHWRVRLSPAPERLPWLRIAAFAIPALQRPPLALWAAVVCARVREWMEQRERDYATRREYHALFEPVDADRLQELLHAGLDSPDPDLAFACALGLYDSERLQRELSSPLEGKRTLARRALANRADAGIAAILRDGSDQLCYDVLRALPHEPVPAQLVEPLAQCMERCCDEVRTRAAARLEPHLSPEVMRRIVAVAVREQDADVATALVRAPQAPEPEWFSERFMTARLVERSPFLRDGLSRMAREGRLSAPFALRWLDAQHDAPVILGALPVIEAVLQQSDDESLWRHVAVQSLSNPTGELRVEMYLLLLRQLRSRSQFLRQLEMSRVWEAFGDERAALRAVLRTLADHPTLRSPCYYEWVDHVLDGIEPVHWHCCNEDGALVRELLQVSWSVYANSDLHPFLRGSAAKLVRRLGAVQPQREQVLATVRRFVAAMGEEGAPKFDIAWPILELLKEA